MPETVSILSDSEVAKSIRAFDKWTGRKLRPGFPVKISIKNPASGRGGSNVAYLLGQLIDFVVLNDDEEPRIMTPRGKNLCSNNNGTQLFIVSGMRRPRPSDDFSRLEEEYVRQSLKKFDKFHWEPGDGSCFVAPLPVIPDHGEFIGYLGAVTYKTKKEGDHKPMQYLHAFQLPLAAVVRAGKELFIVGGGYTVEPRGIVK